MLQRAVGILNKEMAGGASTMQPKSASNLALALSFMVKASAMTDGLLDKVESQLDAATKTGDQGEDPVVSSEVNPCPCSFQLYRDTTDSREFCCQRRRLRRRSRPRRRRRRSRRRRRRRRRGGHQRPRRRRRRRRGVDSQGPPNKILPMNQHRCLPSPYISRFQCAARF